MAALLAERDGVLALPSVRQTVLVAQAAYVWYALDTSLGESLGPAWGHVLHDARHKITPHRN